jgi:CRP/FNR family transcriptional regulator, cyclic AMP receptor protein
VQTRASSSASAPSQDGSIKSAPVLALDPELGTHLPEHEREAALRHAVGDLLVVRRGLWRPPAGPLAVLLLDGPMLLERAVGGAVGVELLGEGDIVLLSRPSHDGFLELVTSWQAFDELRVVLLDARFARAARQWPGLGVALMERAEQRIERMAALSAIGGLVRVDARILLALWQLSERWGRVTPDGVHVPIGLTHRLLANLVGARRPSVTTAITELQREGRLERRDDGWLLIGPPPSGAAPVVKGPWAGAALDGASA